MESLLCRRHMISNEGQIPSDRPPSGVIVQQEAVKSSSQDSAEKESPGKLFHRSLPALTGHTAGHEHVTELLVSIHPVA